MLCILIRADKTSHNCWPAMYIIIQRYIYVQTKTFTSDSPKNGLNFGFSVIWTFEVESAMGYEWLRLVAVRLNASFFEFVCKSPNFVKREWELKHNMPTVNRNTPHKNEWWTHFSFESVTINFSEIPLRFLQSIRKKISTHETLVDFNMTAKTLWGTKDSDCIN